MSNINEKSNFECKIFWKKDCLLPDDALKLDLNISNTTYEESLLLATTYDTKVFRSPEGLVFKTRGDTAEITSYKGTAEDVIIPSTFKHYDKTYKVTSIGDHAFLKCENLTSISISDGVTSIGWSAFKNCKNLTSITIPNSVKNIDSHAFENCSSLTSVTIGNGVTSIDNDAFYNCSSLTSVTFENTSGWKTSRESISSVDLANTSTAARYLTSKYCGYNWKRS